MTSYHTRDSVEEEKNRCPIGQSFIYKSTFCGVHSQITTPIIPLDNISFILQAQPVTKSGRSSLPLCPYCKKGRHLEAECWTKHPNKRPPERPPEDDRQQNQSNGTVNSVNVNELTRANEEWVLDTGTGWTITHDRSLFISFLPLNSSKVNLPNETNNPVLGVGTIQLPFGNDFIIQNVQYIPAFK